MAKVDLVINGKDNGASAAVKGVTGSIITAQLAVEGIKIATQALINAGKKSIEMFRTQEQILAKLNVQTGGNTESIEKWTSEIQNATTIGDEASQTLASLGLSMGITQDKLEGATKGAIGLSESLGIDLNTSMKMVALANEGEYNMLARYIPALRTAKDDSEKMAIVQTAMANGYDLATAKAETFTGRLDQLKNIQGDNYEAFGKIVSIIGKDFVESMVNGQKALNDFLTDADKIAAIGATFDVVKEVFKDIGSSGFSVLKDSLTDIKTSFTKLTEGMSGSFSAFDIIAGAVKIFNIGLGVAIKFVSTIIQQQIDWITVLKNVGIALFAVMKALANPLKWGEAKDELAKVKDSFLDMTSNVLENTKDMIDGVVTGFKDFPKDVKKSADDYAKVWAVTNQKIKDDFKKTNEDIKDIQTTGNAELEAGAKDTTAKQEVTWKDWVNAMKSIGDELYSTLMDARAEAYEGLFQQQQEWQEAQLESVDDWANREMESQGVRLATKQEQLQEEIGILNEKLATETDAEQRASLQQQIIDKNKELKRTQILDAAEKKKEDIQKKAKEKETALKKKQFEENKIYSIAQIWINAASAVMGWWAAFGSMGIPGIVLAGVMTAATLAMAGVQTGLVASQTFHGEEGGEIPIGTSTGDRAVTFMNKGEALLKSEDYKSLVGMARGESGGSTYSIANINMYGVNDPVTFAEQLNDLQRRERNR